MPDLQCTLPADRHAACLLKPRRCTALPISTNPVPSACTSWCVGIEIVGSSLVGKWKVGQDRSEADRNGMVKGLQAAGEPQAGLLGGLGWSPLA